jgi:hypothetical protein
MPLVKKALHLHHMKYLRQPSLSPLLARIWQILEQETNSTAQPGACLPGCQPVTISSESEAEPGSIQSPWRRSMECHSTQSICPELLVTSLHCHHSYRALDLNEKGGRQLVQRPRRVQYSKEHNSLIPRHRSQATFAIY